MSAEVTTVDIKVEAGNMGTGLIQNKPVETNAPGGAFTTTKDESLQFWQSMH